MTLQFRRRNPSTRPPSRVASVDPPRDGGRLRRPPPPRRRPTFPRAAAAVAAVVAAALASAQDPRRSFCGASRADASSHCLERRPCPGGTDGECAAGHRCFLGTACDARRPARDAGGVAEAAENMLRDDPRRRLFCGRGGGEAEGGCGAWCPDGTNAGCPAGWNCVERTGCYYGDDLAPGWRPVRDPSVGPAPAPPATQARPAEGSGEAPAAAPFRSPTAGPAPVPPTATPVRTPTAGPSPAPPTAAPVRTPTLGPSPVPRVPYMDPSNMRHCGATWTLALAACSVATNCPSGSDAACPGGQRCFGGMSQCNVVDLAAVDLAAVEAVGAGAPPLPTMPAATLSRTDPRNQQYCGACWVAAEDACSVETHCPGNVCPSGLICYGGIRCNAETTRSPTGAPTTGVPTPKTPNPTVPRLTRPTMVAASQMVSLTPTIPRLARPPTVGTSQMAQTTPPANVVHGLCADSFEHLRHTFRVAPRCTNVAPCEKGQICYPDVDVNLAAHSTIEASPSVVRVPSVTVESTLSPTPPTIGPDPYAEVEDPLAAHSAMESSPQAQLNSLASANKFYCASSMTELETSCGGAAACDFSSKICPLGQTCFQYDECHDTRPTPDAAAAEDPDLCPSSFVGLHSPEGDCKHYYDCKNGLVYASHTCQEGQLFDRNTGECVNERFVNNKCEHTTGKLALNESKGDTPGISKQTPSFEAGLEQQFDLLPEENVPANYLPDLCPLGFVGAHSLGGDCEQYFDCRDGLFENFHTCGAGLKFDNGQGRCISQKLVDSQCNAVVPETSSDHNQTIDASEGNVTSFDSTSSSENEAGKATGSHDQVVGSSEGNNIKLLPDPASEEDQQILASLGSREEPHQESKLNGIQYVISPTPSLSPSPTSVTPQIASFDSEGGANKEKAALERSGTPTPTIPRIDLDQLDSYWREAWFGDRAPAHIICCDRWILAIVLPTILAMQLL